MAAGLAPAIVLIGFMGAGKSMAARDLARALEVEAVDLDQRLERELGTTIPEYFTEHGEAAFREREEHTACTLLRDADGGVIALGGGALGSEATRAALARHTVVWIDVDADVAWLRTRGSTRPLAADEAAFRALHAEREATYRDAADVILPTASAAVAALDAIRRRPAGTKVLWARAASGEYPVYVGAGLLASGFQAIDGRAFLVSDERVAPLHGGGFDVAGKVLIPPGEEHKTLAVAERVHRELAAAGATRQDHVLALGGGVVGDLAGFCAATYQRGVAVVQAPTTLVAQVDSAYGGKTGVDLPEGKNYVGAYHQPAAVIVDPHALATLPPEERAAGYAEVVKTGLIAGGELWERVRGGAVDDQATILACARAKLAIVAEDERDSDRRQVLNLGHTVAHAIETVTGYARYRHGEAVALGLLAALRLSGQGQLRDEVEELLRAQGLPTSLDPAVDVDEIVRATARDKKRLGEAPVPFVLLAAPGDAHPGQPVAPDALRACVEELRP